MSRNAFFSINFDPSDAFVSTLEATSFVAIVRVIFHLFHHTPLVSFDLMFKLSIDLFGALLFAFGKKRRAPFIAVKQRFEVGRSAPLHHPSTFGGLVAACQYSFQLTDVEGAD
jgi:hypothetical protein